MSAALIPPLTREFGLGMTSQRARDRMIERLRQQDISDPEVLGVMAQLPRHAFVDEALASRAYEDTALPIGQGQTISQPYAVARMTSEILRAPRPTRVLEIGTGCGYQAAVLGSIVAQVYTIERIEELLRGARRRFRQLGLQNIRSRHADGCDGWIDEAPFDAILMTAAGSEVPLPLLAQLADGGRLIAPVGDGQSQRLYCYEREQDRVKRSDLGPAMFVPLRGGVR